MDRESRENIHMRKHESDFTLAGRIVSEKPAKDFIFESRH
jgi:hypothetical protein